MWDYLNGLAQIGTLSLLIYDSTVNLASGDVIRTGCIDIEKSLVVTKIQVCLRPILRHEALSVLIRVERTRIHIEIWIEFLNGDPKVPGLPNEDTTPPVTKTYFADILYYLLTGEQS